MTTVKTFRSV